MIIDPQNIIHNEKYYTVCDYTYDDVRKSQQMLNLPTGTVLVDTGSIPEFFNDIKGRSEKYIVVSPRCDYSVCYQQYNLPCFDLHKWIKMMMVPAHGYSDLHMPARLNKKRCKQTDRYSIKCWSYTEATFNEIPSNVIHWFVVNCEINEPNVTAIPFGINGTDGNMKCVDLISNFVTRKTRDKLLYVNFQWYTSDRYELYQFFQNCLGEECGVTCKRDVSFEEYVEDLATHKFVLCPDGNGIDCYRTLEAVYMGAIPIISSNPALMLYHKIGYPVVSTPNMFAITPELLYNIYNDIPIDRFLNLDKALWPHWRSIIEDKKSCLI